MNITFVIDAVGLEELTWDDYVAMEQGNMTQTKEIMATFLIDESGHKFPLDQAKKRLGQLKTREIEKAQREFRKVFQDSYVPPASGGG